MENDNIATQSPLPKSKPIVAVDFYNALKMVMDGRKITKLEWDNEKIFGIFDGGHLRLHKEDGLHDWILSDGDINGTDWVELKN